MRLTTQKFSVKRMRKIEDNGEGAIGEMRWEEKLECPSRELFTSYILLLDDFGPLGGSEQMSKRANKNFKNIGKKKEKEKVTFYLSFPSLILILSSL
jgi:hypothetical protein